MPPLNEGSILYMPITLPGIGITEAGASADPGRFCGSSRRSGVLRKDWQIGLCDRLARSAWRKPRLCSSRKANGEKSTRHVGIRAGRLRGSTLNSRAGGRRTSRSVSPDRARLIARFRSPFPNAWLFPIRTRIDTIRLASYASRRQSDGSEA